MYVAESPMYFSVCASIQHHPMKAFHLNRYRPLELVFLQDLQHRGEIDHAGAQDGEIPRLEFAVVVFHFHRGHVVDALFQLRRRIQARVVEGDVAGVEVDPNVGVIDLPHGFHVDVAVSAQVGMGFQDDDHPMFLGEVARPPQPFTGHLFADARVLGREEHVLDAHLLAGRQLRGQFINARFPAKIGIAAQNQGRQAVVGQLLLEAFHFAPAGARP